MLGRKCRMKLRISRFLNNRRRTRVSRSTTRDRECCGNTCCMATNSRSRSDGSGATFTWASGLAEVGGCTTEVFRDFCCVKGRCEYTCDLRLPVEEKYDGGMIYGVVPARQFHFVHCHAERGGQTGDGLIVAGQSDEVRIEGVHVQVHCWRRVALRVDADEHYFEARNGGRFFDLGELQQGCRAHIRAVGEPEEHQGGLALQVVQ